jgi:hypothetical protein
MQSGFNLLIFYKVYAIKMLHSLLHLVLKYHHVLVVMSLSHLLFYDFTNVNITFINKIINVNITFIEI